MTEKDRGIASCSFSLSYCAIVVVSACYERETEAWGSGRKNERMRESTCSSASCNCDLSCCRRSWCRDSLSSRSNCSMLWADTERSCFWQRINSDSSWSWSTGGSSSIVSKPWSVSSRFSRRSSWAADISCWESAVDSQLFSAEGVSVSEPRGINSVSAVNHQNNKNRCFTHYTH